MSEVSTISQLYSAFVDVPKPKSIEHCPCCMTEVEIESLLSIPLNELPQELMSTYAGNAFHTVGDADAYHYFFPRLLELLITERWISDFEVVLGNLKRANWNQWQKKEKDAVISVVDECFNSLTLSDDEFSGFEIEGILCGIARSGLPIISYLERLISPDRSPAFENFVLLLSDAHVSGKLKNGFWDDAPEAKGELLAWLQGDMAKLILAQKLGMKFN